MKNGHLLPWAELHFPFGQGNTYAGEERRNAWPRDHVTETGSRVTAYFSENQLLVPHLLGVKSLSAPWVPWSLQHILLPYLTSLSEFSVNFNKKSKAKNHVLLWTVEAEVSETFSLLSASTDGSVNRRQYYSWMTCRAMLQVAVQKYLSCSGK
jgi:hypothetical protein